MMKVGLDLSNVKFFHQKDYMCGNSKKLLFPLCRMCYDKNKKNVIIKMKNELLLEPGVQMKLK